VCAGNKKKSKGEIYSGTHSQQHSQLTIHENDLGLSDATHGHRETAFHTAGESADQLIADIVEVDRPQLIVDHRCALVAGHILQLSEDLEVLSGGQIVPQDVVLRAHTHETADRLHLGNDAVAVYEAVAIGGLEQTREDVDCGGLARAVVAKEAKDLSFLDRGAKPSQGQHVACSLP